MLILVSRSMFSRSKNLIVPFILSMILTLLGHDLCKVTFSAIYRLNTVNQQILAATKFGVSQNKVIWR